MHFQCLIEDESGGIVVEYVMDKLREEGYQFTVDYKKFQGIGGFKKTGKVNEIKTNKLLNDLLINLRGFDKYFSAYEACIVVVVDNDKRDTEEFREQLYRQAAYAMISVDHVFCIAVEEMEAWLLGDREALFQAYPEARESKYKEYKQDSICGTWECLADVVYKGGLKKLKKDCTTYNEIGKCKMKWAREIGQHMNLNANVSPSFNRFVGELRSRL